MPGPAPRCPGCFAVAAGAPLRGEVRLPRLGWLMRSRWRKSQLLSIGNAPLQLSSIHSLLCDPGSSSRGPALPPAALALAPSQAQQPPPTLPRPPQCHGREECGPDVILHEAALLTAPSLGGCNCSILSPPRALPSHSLLSLPGSLLHSLLNLCLLLQTVSC